MVGGIKMSTIIIPSKKIYSPTHQKIRDNIVNQVNNNVTIITKKTELDTIVNTFSRSGDVFLATVNRAEYTSGEDVKDNGYSSVIAPYSPNLSTANIYVAYSEYRNYKIRPETIDIIIDNNNRFVSKLLNDKENNGIDWEVVCDVETYNQALVNFTMNYGLSGIKKLTCQLVKEGNKAQETEIASLPKSYNYKHTFNKYAYETKLDETLDVEVNTELLVSKNYMYNNMFESVLSVKPRIVQYGDKDCYELRLYFPAQVDILTSGVHTAAAPNVNDFTINGVKATIKRYIPKQIKLSIYGDIVTLNLSQKNIATGNGTTNVYSVLNNELLQENNFWITPSNELIDRNALNILEEYINGKEVATIQCSVSDYFDKDGRKVIDVSSTKKPLFEIGDVVIPHYMSSNSVDVPFSYYSDKVTPKKFKVLKNKISYCGAPFQELTIQEINN